MPSQTLPRRARKFTDAERAASRQEKRAEARQQVERATRALLSSDGWRQWAQTRATFHDYSWSNCALIAMQRPDATRVAGFKAWQQLGRQVRKGERAIRIMAPMTVSRENVETGEDERVLFFRAVPVFDIAQTDGAPLPEAPCEPITGDSHAHLIDKLTGHARDLGYTVTTVDTGHAGGYCDAERKVIALSDRLEHGNARVRVLVHELAHAHGVGYRDYGRRDAEVIVETAAVIVCGAVGLDTSGESIPYIAGWGEANDLAAIGQYAATVDEIACKLEAACGIGGAR